MATRDILDELNKDITLDPSLERRICEAVLKLMVDSNLDVQSEAVKCLTVLCAKVQEKKVSEIFDNVSTGIIC